jgi:hypothetical protein
VEMAMTPMVIAALAFRLICMSSPVTMMIDVFYHEDVTTD